MLKLPKVKVTGGLRERLEAITYRQWVIAAMLVSCLMGVLVYLSLSGESTSEKKSSDVPMVKIVVAKQDIPERTIIKDTMLKVVEVPADAVPPGAIKEVSEADGAPASTAISQGDIITDKKFYADVRLAGFTGTIPPNCRAVSVAITDITGVAGFGKAGDYVDVMLITGKREDGLHGEVLMQNVLLLAVNKTGEQATKKEEPAKDKKKDDKAEGDGSIKASGDAMATATLALPLDEALKIAVASQQGTIYLVLRPYKPADLFTLSKTYSVPGEKSTQVKQSAPAPAATPAPQPVRQSAPAAAAPAASAPQGEFGRTIEVIRGTERAKVGVN